MGWPPPAPAADEGEGGADLGPEEARQPADAAEAGPGEAADAERLLPGALLAAEVVAPEEGLPPLHVLPLLLPPEHVVRPEQ